MRSTSADAARQVLYVTEALALIAITVHLQGAGFGAASFSQVC
jgi:hypothetical protein